MHLKDFHAKWRASGPWQVSAIGKQIEARTFTDLDELLKWLEARKRLNIYFSPNKVRGLLNRKASKGDIESSDWYWVDIDARAGHPLDRELKRIREALENFAPRPTCVIFSGGGYQAFWRRKLSLIIADNYEQAERINNLLIERLGGDPGTGNVDRIMRHPGTINWPTPQKLAKHPERIPTKTEVLWFEDTVYEDKDFLGEVTTGRLPDVHALDKYVQNKIPEWDWVKMVLVQGLDPEEPSKHPSRSEWQYAASCALVRAGIPDDVHRAVLLDPGFQISASVLDKGKSAEKYVTRQIKRAHEQRNACAELEEVNSSFAVVDSCGGKCRILHEVMDPQTGLQGVDFLGINDFCLSLGNRKVQIGESTKGIPKFAPLAKWWLAHPERRQFHGVVFDPARDYEGYYNLWRGFAVEPGKGSCGRFLEHIHTVLCRGDDELYKYVIQWMARAVQFPGEPGLTAIVMRGRQGTGKSFYAHHFGRLFGPHFLSVSNSDHLVGKFNAHLQSCVVLFGDEAFWANDKKHESSLKTLITEKRLIIERKGLDPYQVSNCTHVIMASNDGFVIPAGVDDRRFLVLDLSDHNARNNDYFAEIEEELILGGYGGLLRHLQELPLESFDVRNPPSTSALTDQKTYTLDAVSRWWFERLRDGKVLSTHADWQQNVALKHLEYELQISSNRKVTITALRQFLRKTHNGLEIKQQRIAEDLPELDGRIVTVHRPYYLLLPSLSDCRADWDRECFPAEWPTYGELS